MSPHQDYDRRRFLKGAAITTGAFATATMSPRQAGAVEVPPSRWTRTADVVILGTGFAGMTAAITAHDAGAKVLVLEKAPEEFKGGNSKICAGGILWPDDIEKAKVYFKSMAGPYIDDISDAFIDVWAKETSANRAWLDKMGLKYNVVKVASNGVGASDFPEMPGADCANTLIVQGGLGDARLYNNLIEPNVTSRKIETLYQTRATTLVRRGSEIVGVAADQNGHVIHVKANRAVIFACGGFQYNQVMIRNYLANMPRAVTVGTPYNTGDGIRMAMEVGADLWHMNNVAGPLFAFQASDMDIATLVQFHAPNYLFIGADGARFVGEGPPFAMSRHGSIKLHGQWVQTPTPLPVHAIFDETARKAGGIAGNATGINFGWDYIHGNRYGWSNDNSREIAKGWIKKGETIRDLASAINVAPDALETTATRFNKICEDKVDSDFNRRPGTFAPIATPPFYAIELLPTMINTQGGPRRDEYGRVIGADDKPIPRLYSAGELGSYHGYLYDNGNVSECFSSGRIAGRSAAALKPWSAY